MTSCLIVPGVLNDHRFVYLDGTPAARKILPKYIHVVMILSCKTSIFASKKRRVLIRQDEHTRRIQ